MNRRHVCLPGSEQVAVTKAKVFPAFIPVKAYGHSLLSLKEQSPRNATPTKEDMKIAKSTVVLLIFVLMLSIFVANVADLINVDSHVQDESLQEIYGETHGFRPKYYDIGKSYDHLMWFLQVC